MLRHLVNLLLRALPPTRCFALRRALWRLAGLRLGRNVRICGRGWIFGPGQVAMGDDTWLSPGVTIYSHRMAPISIGTRCDIGHEVCILTGGHEIGPAERRAGPGTALPVTIGDGCWIGARATILGGTRIGAGSIVGAGALVSGDVPENVLVAGVPARVKRALN